MVFHVSPEDDKPGIKIIGLPRPTTWTRNDFGAAACARGAARGDALNDSDNAAVPALPSARRRRSLVVRDLAHGLVDDLGQVGQTMFDQLLAAAGDQ